MKSYGYSMIELMIVLAIVVFFATISVPKYFNYYSKAKQAEVALNLASLHTAQQAYFAEHGIYSNVLFGENGIGWKPQGYKGGGKQENFYYTYGFNFPGAQEGVNFFTGRLEASKDDLGECYAGKDNFVAKAAGDITGKGKVDVWQIDADRRMENIQKGLD